jgi:hypothetical protein
LKSPILSAVAAGSLQEEEQRPEIKQTVETLQRRQAEDGAETEQPVQRFPTQGEQETR